MTVSLGDLAQNFQFTRQSTQVRTELVRLTSELSTGKPVDISTHLRGNFGPYTQIERALTVFDAYESSVNEAALISSTMQTALGKVEGLASDTGVSLLTTSSAGDADLLENASLTARDLFEVAVQTLNTTVAGRSIFAGAASDAAALADADTMMAAIAAAAATAATAADVETAVDAWFASGGDFDTVGYIGSTTPFAPAQLNERISVTLDVTASDPAVRDALAGLAMAALISLDIPTANPSEQTELGRLAGERLVVAGEGVVHLRADLGASEERIEYARTTNAAEVSSLTIARTKLVEIDPYEAAIELESVQAQLETLYTLTSRMSRLSLVNYI